MCPSRIRRGLSIGLLFIPLLTNAQGASRRDSLKQVIADHRLRMHVADSIGDPKASVRVRLELAPLVGGAEKLQLLLDAAAGAQSAALLEEEVLVRRELADALARSGKSARAFEEAVHVTALVEALAVEQQLRSTAKADSVRADLMAERDSLEGTWQEALEQARHREAHFETTADRWFFTLIGVLCLATLVIVFLSMRARTGIGRVRAELQQLRAEVQELKKPRNTFKSPPDPVLPRHDAEPAPPLVEPLAPELRLPADELAAGMFLRTAPERLATFKEARLRGDREKAVRVVHTLKPLLVGIDAAHFTPLCARLVAPEALATPAWNADADALETAIATLLARG